MSQEATIKIHRRKNWAGSLRKFTLFVDDKKIGTIADGKEECFRVPLGNHSIFVQAAWWSRTDSIELNLNPGNIKSFESGVTRWYSLQVIIVPILIFIFHCSPDSFWLRIIVLCIFTGVLLSTIAKPGGSHYLKEVDDPK